MWFCKANNVENGILLKMIIRPKCNIYFESDFATMHVLTCIGPIFIVSASMIDFRNYVRYFRIQNY